MWFCQCDLATEDSDGFADAEVEEEEEGAGADAGTERGEREDNAALKETLDDTNRRERSKAR